MVLLMELWEAMLFSDLLVFGSQCLNWLVHKPKRLLLVGFAGLHTNLVLVPLCPS